MYKKVHSCIICHIQEKIELKSTVKLINKIKLVHIMKYCIAVQIWETLLHAAK